MGRRGHHQHPRRLRGSDAGFSARRDPKHLSAGDTVDCWRVELIKPGERLRLVAEMKLPGRAWLDFEIQPESDGARLRQVVHHPEDRATTQTRLGRDSKTSSILPCGRDKNATKSGAK